MSEQPRPLEELVQLSDEEPISVAEIMEIVEYGGVHKGNFEELVPMLLRAVCKDEYVDAVESFIHSFEAIDWDWWPNG